MNLTAFGVQDKPQGLNLSAFGVSNSASTDTTSGLNLSAFRSTPSPTAYNPFSTSPMPVDLSKPFSSSFPHVSLNDAKAAIAKNEGSGSYTQLGPMTKGGAQAYGKYQVMDFNIPTWTKEALGKSLTP